MEALFHFLLIVTVVGVTLALLAGLIVFVVYSVQEYLMQKRHREFEEERHSLIRVVKPAKKSKVIYLKKDNIWK